MEATNVNPEYELDWKYDYLGLPECEVQRVTDAYTVGYEYGSEKIFDNFDKWRA